MLFSKLKFVLVSVSSAGAESLETLSFNYFQKKKKRQFYFRGCEFSSRQALGEIRSMCSLLLRWSTGKKGSNCFRERGKRGKLPGMLLIEES